MQHEMAAFCWLLEKVKNGGMCIVRVSDSEESKVEGPELVAIACGQTNTSKKEETIWSVYLRHPSWLEENKIVPYGCNCE